MLSVNEAVAAASQRRVSAFPEGSSERAAYQQITDLLRDGNIDTIIALVGVTKTLVETFPAVRLAWDSCPG